VCCQTPVYHLKIRYRHELPYEDYELQLVVLSRRWFQASKGLFHVEPTFPSLFRMTSELHFPENALQQRRCELRKIRAFAFHKGNVAGDGFFFEPLDDEG
jgi:hypothetical protein